VFTPPEDADDVSPEDASGATGEAGERAVKNEFCPICGETYAADADPTNCPNCNAVLDRD
jgi:rubrerythrin